jgi:hypothetical protein
LLATQGRPYYLAAAYPMLLAAGAVVIERWLASLPALGARFVQAITWAAFIVSGVAFALLALPITTINSPLWDVVSDINGELKEMVGWPDLVESVAAIYATLPAEEKAVAGILTGNYGEAGAINLYGPAYGLPQAISGVNSYWLRGYGNPPPQTVIVLGSGGAAYSYFGSCQFAGAIKNRFGVMNEESRDHPAVYVCRAPRQPWPDLWQRLRSFG